MIYYENGMSGCNLLFQCRGSVFPFAFIVALPSTLAAFSLKFCDNHDLLGEWSGLGMISNAAAFTGFNMLVGFVIVFRTSQAYARFWHAVFDMHQMCANWYDSCSSAIGCCRPSKRPDHEVAIFVHTMVRLFSILTGAALQQLCDDTTGFEALDPEALDEETLRCYKESGHKVELTFQWIHHLMVDGVTKGIIAVPAPIATRTFQQLNNGLVNFYDTLKDAQIPFPFPYAQTTCLLLILHSLVTPLVIVEWTEWVSGAVLFTFTPVFTLWAMNAIAQDIETPFGGDPNDLEPQLLQRRNNQLLALLLDHKTIRCPTIEPGHASNLRCLADRLVSHSSKEDFLSRVHEAEEPSAPCTKFGRFRRTVSTLSGSSTKICTDSTADYEDARRFSRIQKEVASGNLADGMWSWLERSAEGDAEAEVKHSAANCMSVLPSKSRSRDKTGNRRSQGSPSEFSGSAARVKFATGSTGVSSCSIMTPESELTAHGDEEGAVVMLDGDVLLKKPADGSQRSKGAFPSLLSPCSGATTGRKGFSAGDMGDGDEEEALSPLSPQEVAVNC